ncbi:MAG: hypothetical protein ACI8P0_000166 [Planctomycetaceae bacterium]|jgi:hypothetical protein
MNLSIRMRVSIAAAVVVAAGLVGCQTTRDYVDGFPRVNFPRPTVPSFDRFVLFGNSKPRTHAEPYHAPKLEPVPDVQEPLILPAPASTNSPGRATSRPVSSPPALPPFEAETPVPSAGLFPSGPVRRMGFETSSVIKDSNIIQTGCCAPIVQSCCPPPCCPTPCCETSCCSTGCGLSSLLGTVTTPFYVAKYKIQNAKARLHCKLSAIGSSCSPCSSPCCAPCAPSCSPCGSCVSNEYVMEGVVVNQYPLNGGCSTCSSGMNSVPQIPMHYQAAPQQSWRQPTQQFRRPQAPCGCQNQQAAQYPAPRHQHPPQQYYAPQQPTQAPPQYQGARPTYPQPQVAVRQPVAQPQYQPTYRPTPAPQQRVAQPYQYRPQPAPQQQRPSNRQSVQAPAAQPQQNYTAPLPVQPAMPQEPSASSAPPADEPQTSSLVPGHSPLTSSPSRVARVYRATRFQ